MHKYLPSNYWIRDSPTTRYMPSNTFKLIYTLNVYLVSAFSLLSVSWIFTQTKGTGLRGFPGSPSGKESACQCRRHKRHKFYPCIGRIPWRRKWHPPLGFLPWKFHGQRSLMGYRPWGCEESNVTEDAHLPFNWYITGLIAIALSCRIYKSSRLICIKLVSQE